MSPSPGRESELVLQHAFRRSGWSVSELWIAATGVGGELRRRDVTDITAGERYATAAEHDVLATALNDYFTDRGEDHPVALWHASG